MNDINRGATGREGPRGREGDVGREGIHGIQGERGKPGINAINSLTHNEFLVMRGAFWFAICSFLLMVATPFVLFGYPFKTVVFIVPVEITNPDKRVPSNGVVHLRIISEKFINEPGLVVRTLVAIKSAKEVEPLDSSTVISIRPKGKYTSDSVFLLTQNPNVIGKNRKIIFSIYHTLFGIRQMMVQFESEPFEIYDEKKSP